MPASTVARDTRRHATRFEAIGTHWEIETAEPVAPLVMRELRARIDEFDRAYSRFRSDSLVSRLAMRGGACEFPDDAEALLSFYDALWRISDGAVSPLVGGRLAQLGYPGACPGTLPVGSGDAVPRWPDVVERRGTHVSVTRPVMIDVGAAGKGYLADIVCALLEKTGHSDAVVDASGDIVLGWQAPVPMRVALEHPADARLAIGVAELDGGAICGSASNRRRWGEGLHHVLDARTGNPVDDIVATWAVASTGLAADGLATALFVTDPLRLETSFDFTWVRMFADGHVEYSSGFVGQIFGEGAR